MHIDWWTLALQAVNVLILVWILARFLYRPVAAMIERRRVAAVKELADASAMRTAVEAEQAAIRATRDGLAAEREKLLADARKEIETTRNEMLHDTSQRIETLRAENVAVLARERSEMEQELGKQASSLAVQIAQKLLERLSADATTAIFLDALSAQIKALPPKTRELLVAPPEGGAFNVTTASELNDAQQRQCRNAIEAALGCEVNITFGTDPKLIAGMEVNAGALVLKNNWQADLAQILEQLRSDGERA